jgi:circadian clock protein KaiC
MDQPSGREKTVSIRQASLERHSTGSEPLDHILGGGLLSRSVNVVAGAPGSGKTVLVLQVLFHLARQGKKSLYFTTLSEPSIKLIGYMQQFSFFDVGLMETMIQFVDLGTTLREDGERTLDEILRRVEEGEPAVVVIDSFKAVSDLLPDAARARTFVYDLAVQMAGWGAITLLVGEYTDEEIAHRPEFAVADGILRLGSRRSELTSTREIDILKLRGADYVTGCHFFEIGSDGLTFYPRVRAADPSLDIQIPLSDRIATGIPGLDQLLDGGLPRASASVVHGGTGTGKTMLGLHFLLEGTRRGEPGILFTLEETSHQIREVARGFGWDLAALEAKGLLTVAYEPPVELSTDRFLDRARRQVSERRARRVVVDSLTSMALGVPSERRFKELVYALTKHLRAAEASLLMTMETPELLGSTQISGHGVSFAADNVIQLRYVELGGRLDRGISVLKARGVRHGTELRVMHIGARGVEIGKAYPTVRGVLSGVGAAQDEL